MKIRNLFLSLFAALLMTPVYASGGSSEYLVLDVSGVIDAATADYISKAIDKAEKTNAAGVILRMDTPGGMLKATRRIVDRVLASKVPVITHVAPKGARAASAGTFILLSSHIAAMAEGTNIGTASPIELTGNKASEKITNDSIAWIKNLARMSGRSEAWAEEAITKNVSSSEMEALKIGVIDVIAPDTDSLIRALKGKKIKMGENETPLKTENTVFRAIPLSVKHKFLHFLADPNISYILFIIGIYGLMYELTHPGVLFPGIAGAISITLAFIGFDSIPINIAGGILILIAVVLFVAEAFTPAFGVLTLGGIIAFVTGSLLLFPSRALGESWAPSYVTIGVMSLLTLAVIGVVLMLIIRAIRKKHITGPEAAPGMKGVAKSVINEKGGFANIGGEEWQAFSDEEIAERELVEVISEEGIKLKVKKIERKKKEEE